MVRRTKEEAEQTRLEIIKASLNLFSEKGYSKTTFDEIAKCINKTKGAVYWHFRNKPDLLVAVIKDAITKLNDHICTIMPETNNINDLKKYFLYLSLLIESSPELRKFMFFALYQMEWSEKIYKKVNKSLEDILDYPKNRIKETLKMMKKRGEIAKDINVDEISEIFFCFWKGAVDNEILKSGSTKFMNFVSNGFDMIIGRLKEER